MEHFLCTVSSPLYELIDVASVFGMEGLDKASVDLLSAHGERQVEPEKEGTF